MDTVGSGTPGRDGDAKKFSGRESVVRPRLEGGSLQGREP